MKKFLAILLAMMLVLANVAALADDPIEIPVDDIVTVIDRGSGLTPTAATPAITKVYTVPSGLTFSEELSFTVAVVTDGAPEITVGTGNKYTYAAGTDASDTIAINFPEYTEAGVYEYTITEVAGNVQGTTTYDTTTVINVKVYVVYDENGNLVPTANVYTGTTEVEEQKTDTITNVYEVGKLTVTKEISGTFADPDRPFVITVNFDKEADKTVMTPITYKVNGGAAQTISAAALNGTTANFAEIQLKGGESAVFENIPYGVTYTVTENTGDNYVHEITGESGNTQIDKINDPDAYEIAYDGKETGMIQSATAATTITNTKDIEVPTGIAVETVPYIVIIALAAMMFVALKARKREEY